MHAYPQKAEPAPPAYAAELRATTGDFERALNRPLSDLYAGVGWDVCRLAVGAMYEPPVCCKRKTSKRRHWVLHRTVPAGP